MANEQRLIDADALSVEVDKSKHNNPHPPGMVRVNHRNEHDHFMRMIYDAPTVDAVEVVRCKNCRDCEMGYPEKRLDREATQAWLCKRYKMYRKPDDFCSYGERRDND